MEYSINSNVRPLLDHSEASGSDAEYLEQISNPHEADHVIVDDDDKNLISKRNAPLDKYNFTYIIFYLLGMTTMVPWNFCLTSEDVSIELKDITTNIVESKIGVF